MFSSSALKIYRKFLILSGSLYFTFIASQTTSAECRVIQCCSTCLENWNACREPCYLLPPAQRDICFAECWRVHADCFAYCDGFC